MKILYSLNWVDGTGRQPYEQVESTGAALVGGISVHDGRYLGELSGTDNQMRAAIGACLGFGMLEITDAQAAIFAATGRVPPNTLADIAQAHMDAVVSERGYADILSACSYAGSANPTWAAEGAACAAWRDAVWARTFEIIDAGEPYPEPDVFVGMLPGMVWP